jgi:hypothetical protein
LERRGIFSHPAAHNPLKYRQHNNAPSEFILATTLREVHVETEQPPQRRRWLRRGTVTVLLLAALVWAGDTATSFLVDHSRFRAKITAQLEAAFGRNVEVGSYGFSLWGGPALEAQSVRIDEDPRFGNEYFIRADSISVGLRWWGLLRGHIALGTLSVSGASLNLVRSAGGDWNLAEWLPKPPFDGSSGAAASEPERRYPALQFRRVEIYDSRIDFKREYEKLPFALVNVNGTVETDAPGRWHIDMEASPWRAAVLTQQPGVIHVSGHIGGTSSRLRPAALEILWTNASISDFFRLASGDDYGIRGDMAASIDAHTESGDPVSVWVLNGKAELSGLHRWDMAGRQDNPSLNFVVKKALLDTTLSEFRVSDLRIEAPHSSARASAAFNWTSGEQTAGKSAMIAASDFLDLDSSQVDLGDALAWARAFHPGVPDKTSIVGMVRVRAHLTGRPPRLTNVSVTGERAELTSPALREPARIGPIDLRYNRGEISLRPATLEWSGSRDHTEDSFRIDASARGRNALFPSWHIAGSTIDARGIAELAAALGLNLSRGWDLQGPLSCDLRWQAAQFPWISEPVGTISLGQDGAKQGGAALRVPFLNLPIEQIRAHVEMKPSGSQIGLASAKAFGATWNGTLARRTADAEWRFALSADRITAADLDRWLNPRWRESFLDRMLPFLGTSAAVPSAQARDVRAGGSVNIGEFVLKPLAMGHLAGDLQVDGRKVELSDAKAQFYGGEVSGRLRAQLSAVPTYHAEVAVSRVDGAALAAATPVLAGLRADSIKGQVAIDVKGSSRGDLISSIACKGTARGDGIGVRNLNFDKTFTDPGHAAADTQIATGSAAFTCARRSIQFERLSLVLRDGSSLLGTGSIGFDRNLDIRFQDLSANTKNPDTFRLTGRLSAPQVSSIGPMRRGR